MVPSLSEKSHLMLKKSKYLCCRVLSLLVCFLQVSKFEGHTLYNTEKLLESHPTVFTLKDFKAVVSSFGPPEKPIDPPSPKPVTQDITVPAEFRYSHIFYRVTIVHTQWLACS